METLWRTGLVCTVIVIVFATEVEGGHKDEFAQSQGEWRQLTRARTVTLSEWCREVSCIRLTRDCDAVNVSGKSVEKLYPKRNHVNLFVSVANL